MSSFDQESISAINGFVPRVQARVAGVQHKRTQEGRFLISFAVTHW